MRYVLKQKLLKCERGRRREYEDDQKTKVSITLIFSALQP